MEIQNRTKGNKMKKITELKETIIERIKDLVWWYGAEIVALTIVSMVCAVLLFVGNFAAKQKCYKAYAQFNPEYVGFITGCMITVDEQRVPSSALRMAI